MMHAFHVHSQSLKLIGNKRNKKNGLKTAIFQKKPILKEQNGQDLNLAIAFLKQSTVSHQVTEYL